MAWAKIEERGILLIEDARIFTRNVQSCHALPPLVPRPSRHAGRVPPRQHHCDDLPVLRCRRVGRLLGFRWIVGNLMKTSTSTKVRCSYSCKVERLTEATGLSGNDNPGQDACSIHFLLLQRQISIAIIAKQAWEGTSLEIELRIIYPTKIAVL